jgi:hypothetical protein
VRERLYRFTILTVGSEHGLIRTGARAVLPLWQDRLLISAGAGWGWLRTLERAQPSSSNQQLIGCSGGPASCLSASGSGPTEIVEVMYLPNAHLGIGLQFRNVQVSSSGLDANGLYSHVDFDTTYKDRFFLIGGDLAALGRGTDGASAGSFSGSPRPVRAWPPGAGGATSWPLRLG